MKATILGWATFLLSPFAFTAWDWVMKALRQAPPRPLHCLEARVVLMLIVLVACAIWGTSALRGLWGTLLRVCLIVGQIWLALALDFFVIEPVQAESGIYSGAPCGDL